jgi:sugar phosphate isomerase/epimerase
VKLAVENVGYQGTAIFTMNEYSSFLDPMDDNVGYLIDTGHAFIDHWDIPHLIRTVQDRLLALHLHDNSGSFDQHLAIGAGSIPWEPIWDSVRSTEMRFQLVLEYDAGHSLERIREDKNMLARRLAFRAPSGE